MSGERVGVLLINSGTPEAPEPQAVRAFLARFLSDRRVVALPHLVWLPILYGVVLPRRPQVVTQKYRLIWTPAGSPLRVLTEELAAALREELARRDLPPVAVEAAMLYSSPELPDALRRLRQWGAQRIVAVPLFPQSCGATSGAAYDAVNRVQRRLGKEALPLRFVLDYHSHPPYIEALRESIAAYWQQHGRTQHLVLSFHGIPERRVRSGDPYFVQARKTAQLLAAALGLGSAEWTLSFQSRFGRARWLGPYTHEVLAALPGQGRREVSVVCPGFAVDCLETLEEIAIEGRATFLAAGGVRFEYIPCLNARPAHVRSHADGIQLEVREWATRGTRLKP